MSHLRRYKKLRVLGAGAFGEAHLVEVRETGETAVIKQIWSPVTYKFKSSGKTKDSADHEINLLKKLCHPNIVAYRDSFRNGSSLVIIEMEYCNGGDLHEFIQNQKGKRLSEGQVFDLFVQLCDAIQYIHQHKILHRDIKPQNIFLTTDHYVKLGDFGISRALVRSTEQALTHAGTPLYSSPEVLHYKPYNNKSDIWSAGVVLYELTMLKHPFVEEGKSLEVAMQNILSCTYKSVCLEYSIDHRRMIEKILQKEPSDRPSIVQLFGMPPLHQRLHFESFNKTPEKKDRSPSESEEEILGEGHVTVVAGQETVIRTPQKDGNSQKHSDSGILVDKNDYFQDEDVPIEEINPSLIPSQPFPSIFVESDYEEKSIATGHLVINMYMVAFIGLHILLVILLSYGLSPGNPSIEEEL